MLVYNDNEFALNRALAQIKTSNRAKTCIDRDADCGDASGRADERVSFAREQKTVAYLSLNELFAAGSLLL
jgi:hypothetical protein